MAKVEQIMDELRAGLKAGNVHAVKRATDRILAMGLDPDLQLRAQQPLIERTLQILLKRGKEYQDSAHGPSQHFRTVAHIIDTLTPRDWPGIAKILDDHKHEIIKDLLLRMREGWTASALIAAKDLQRWGQRWPELATIIHTAETDVDSSVLESRDDHDPGSEGLLRYLRSDLARSDYDGALEVIGELSWTVDSTDLSELLDPHKQGLIRAMLTTMSNTHSEGMQYIMPQYLNGLAMLGVHWPELDTIKRSVAAMSGEQKDQLDENYAFGKPAPSEINELFDYLENDEAYYAVLSLYRLAGADLDLGYAEDIAPHKALIIRGMLEWARDEEEWASTVLTAIDTLHNIGLDWPELAVIHKSALNDYNQLAETNLAYVKQDAERGVRGVSAKLEKMRKAGLSWEAYYQLVDALYGVMAVNRGYAHLVAPVLEHYKTDIVRTMLWSVKAALDTGRASYFLTNMLDAFDRARVNWPEIDTIKRSMRAVAQSEIDESTMNPHQMRYIKQTLDNHTPWKAADAMIQQGLRYDSNPEIKALWDANKDRTIVHMLKLIKGDPNHMGIPLMIKDFKTIGLPWSEIDGIARSISAGIAEACGDHVRESITVGEESPEELIAQLEQDLESADYEAALQTLDDLYFHDPQDTAMLLDTHKPGIMRELLKFIKDARTADPVDRAMATRMVTTLRKHGARWPELDIITQSLKAIDDIHEAWSKKYKKSINCAHPRGFSQKAHCAARRKRRAGGKTKSKSVREAINPISDRGEIPYAHIHKPREPRKVEPAKLGVQVDVRRENPRDPDEYVYKKPKPKKPFSLDDKLDEAIRGQQRWIQRVADRLEYDFTHNRDLDIGYAIQELNQTDPSEVQTIFEPLAQGYADWFQRMIDADSVDFGLRELDRLLGYIKQTYPEITTAVNRNKTAIMRYLLTLVRQEHHDLVRRRISLLRDLGADWKELNMITRSLLEDDDPKERERLRSAGRQIMLDLFARDMSKNDSRGIYYVMYHMDDWGFKLADWPEIAALIDDHKHQIVSELLKSHRGDYGRNTEGVRFSLDRMRRIGVTWPELAVIRKSLDAQTQLDESLASPFGSARVIVKIMLKRALARKLGNLSSDRDSVIGKMDVNDPRFVSAVDSAKPLILSEIRKLLRSDDRSANIRGWENTLALHEVGVKWPELMTMLEDNKSIVIKSMLTAIKSDDAEEMARWPQVFRDLGLNWPELDIIQRSLDASQQVTEDESNSNYNYNRFIAAIDDDSEGSEENVAYWLYQVGYEDHNIPYKKNFWSYTEREKVIRSLLLAIKNSTAWEFDDDNISKMVYALKDKLGLDWPELKVIQQSLDAGQPQLTEEFGTFEDTNHMSSKREVNPEGYDQIVDVFRRKLRDGLSRGIFFATFWMEQWNIDVREWPELAEMVEDHKDQIVRDVLKAVKDNGEDGWSYAADMLSRLRNIGINWPELKVIQQSLDAERPQLTEEFGRIERTMNLLALHMSDMWNHLEEGQWKWLVGDLSEIYIILENENLPQQYWPKPKDLDINLEAHKTSFVKGILRDIKLDDGDEGVQAVHMLKDYWHVNWPELDIILKSVDADRATEIDELRGYRSDPVYAAAQKELAPSKMKTASERETAMEKFTDYMETQGFKHIGHGSFSSVYLKDGYPWMFKLWSHDPAYLWWITWAAKHQDNPNVPRVKGLPVRIAPDTYVVRLEKLRGLIRREGNLSKGYDKLAYLVDRIESVDDLSKEDLQWIRSEYPGVYDILRVIQRAGSDFVVDLHGDNIMLRGQVPVITDPVVG